MFRKNIFMTYMEATIFNWIWSLSSTEPMFKKFTCEIPQYRKASSFFTVSNLPVQKKFASDYVSEGLLNLHVLINMIAQVMLLWIVSRIHIQSKFYISFWVLAISILHFKYS